MYILSNDEKSYLRKIAMYTRKDYLRKNKYIFIEDDIGEIDEKFLISIENVEINVEVKTDMEICAPNIENVFKDRKMNKIVKALTLREKLVLFSYYFENKTDAAIGKALNIKGDTARKIRIRALDKAKKEYGKMKGMDWYV